MHWLIGGFLFLLVVLNMCRTAYKVGMWLKPVELPAKAKKNRTLTFKQPKPGMDEVQRETVSALRALGMPATQAKEKVLAAGTATDVTILLSQIMRTHATHTITTP